MIPRAGVKMLADSLDTIGTMARNVEDAAFFAGVLAGRPALPTLPRADGAAALRLYRTPMWAEAEPSTVAALDRARAALERAGASVVEIAVPPEHEPLTAAQETIMGFELVRGLAHERIQHSAELSPPPGAAARSGHDGRRRRLMTPRSPRPRRRGPSSASFSAPCDALLVPAAPGEAPPGLGYTGNPVFNRMWTLLGMPCVTLPAVWGDERIADRHPAGRPDRPRCTSCWRARVFAERALAEAA